MGADIASQGQSQGRRQGRGWRPKQTPGQVQDPGRTQLQDQPRGEDQAQTPAQAQGQATAQGQTPAQGQAAAPDQTPAQGQTQEGSQRQAQDQTPPQHQAHDQSPAQPREAAFFDLDKTVIARSSSMAFSRPLYAGGLISRSAMLRSAYVHFFYHSSGADHIQMERMREQLSRMVIGWDVQQVRDIVATALSELIAPIVYEEATALIAEHQTAGRDVVIISASGAELVEPIGALLGVDHVVATQMTIAEGRYTGTIDHYVYGENKARAIRELAAERGYRLADCYAYSDSVTDLPMLAEVGHPVAVNPDKALRREAQARGWPVRDFSRPVSLRSKFPTQAAARTAALGAGAAAGLVWYASRRKDGEQSSGRESPRRARAASRPE